MQPKANEIITNPILIVVRRGVVVVVNIVVVPAVVVVNSPRRKETNCKSTKCSPGRKETKTGHLQTSRYLNVLI